MAGKEYGLGLGGKPMLELTATDWFWITGRGSAATFETEKNPGLVGEVVRYLQGDYVVVDEVEYQVTGIERYCVSWDHPANQKGPWGLLLKPINECFDSWHWRELRDTIPTECFTCHQREPIYEWYKEVPLSVLRMLQAALPDVDEVRDDDDGRWIKLR